MNLIDITASNTPDAAASFKGRDAIVTLTDDTTISGTFLSVNSKGWNVVVDGATVSRSLARVAMVQVINDDCCVTGDCDQDEVDNGHMDDDTDNGYDDDMGLDPAFNEIADAASAIAITATDTDADALVAELDGATTAELADVFGIAAKDLRVTLRALGMGVGKGRRYHLTADQITTVRKALTPTAA